MSEILETRTVYRASRLAILLALAVALAFALPDSAEAASITEIKKLTASDAQAGHNFGFRVAVSGDVAVIGAVGDDAASGAAYVFQQNEGGGDNWGEAKKLIASDALDGDQLGSGVAVAGDTIVVGACCEDTAGSSAGAAYVFQRNEGGQDNWGEVRKLVASDAQTDDLFGVSVAISGDTIVVGACCEDTGGFSAGAAYVFRRNEGGVNNWGEVKKLTASDAQESDHFGHGVAVSGDTAVVGAVSGNSLGSGGGAVYVFQRDQGGVSNWGEVTKLIPSDGQIGDWFGWSVSLSGDTVVVGAAAIAQHRSAGASYVFQRNQGGASMWREVRKITASDAQANDQFGKSVSLSGDTVVVGAAQEDAADENAGAAYVFERNQGGADNWGEVQKLIASDHQATDFFGSGVAVAGGTVVVGAFREDAGGSSAGAAYVFQGPAPIITPTSTVTVAPTETNTPGAAITPPATDTPRATVTPAATVPPPAPTSLPPVGAPRSGTPPSRLPALLAVAGSVALISFGCVLLHVSRGVRRRS